jgi:hypothetical protein
VERITPREGAEMQTLVEPAYIPRDRWDTKAREAFAVALEERYLEK